MNKLMASFRDCQRGSATVLVLAVVMSCLILILGVNTYSTVLNARSQVQAVADLAAIWGATRLQGGDPGCLAAQKIVQDSKIELKHCREKDGFVRLRVSKQLTVWKVVASMEMESVAGPESG